MATMRRLFIFAILCVGSAAFAAGEIHVEKAAVGDRTLTLTFDDSIQAPDLSKLQIGDYEIENAVFVEEMNPYPTLFAPTYLDLTLPDNGKVVNFLPSSGTLIVDMPSTATIQIGTVIGDTAFGGVLRRVVSIESQVSMGLMSKRWILNTEEGNLPDAILDCDIAFKTNVELSQGLADVAQDQEVAGELADGSPTLGLLGYSLASAQIKFRPQVTGRIRIHNGQVELFRFEINGNCEVAAKVSGSVSGLGVFDFEEELPSKLATLVNLGSGLFLKVQNRPSFRMEATSKNQGITAKGEFRIQNAFTGLLGFSEGKWKPLATNKMTYSEKSIKSLAGEGEIKISLKPRIEVLMNGVQGTVFTFNPYARFTVIPDGIPKVDPITQDSMPASISKNKQLSLGSNIYLEMRTNFFGAADKRSLVLFNYEQTVLSPPREGILSVKESDSGRVSFICQTFPKADYYIIQQKLGSGPWERLLDKTVSPKIRVSTLKPSTQYRFRAIGVNDFGSGPAFPQEGLVLMTPTLNHPPLIPSLQFPDSNAALPDSSITLTWKGGDLDFGAKVVYTILVDTLFPPLAIQSEGIMNTALDLSGLTIGKTYYWKVIASDGIDRTEGPTRSFTIKIPSKVLAAVHEEPSQTPFTLVPKGAFKREDGKLIQVGPFFLDKTEVTQAEFRKGTGRNPSYRLADSLPVERVTWEEAQGYCHEVGGRLPTEAEWEFAARAGSANSYYWGDENPGDYAWYRDNSDNHTQKVGLKKANALGLHDMSGNVFEWVEDWFGDYSPSQTDHPQGPASGTAKVIRGASWYSESANLNLGSRYSNRPGFRNFKVGFRCAKDIETVSIGNNSPISSLAGKSLGADPNPMTNPAGTVVPVLTTGSEIKAEVAPVLP